MAAVRPVILLVTDDPNQSAAVQRVLKRQPATVLQASSPDAAIALAREHGCTVVLVDLRVGIEEAVERFRANPVTRHSPVIVTCSGETDETQTEAIYRAGAADILRCPVSATVLQARLRAVLDLATLRYEAEHRSNRHALLLESAGAGIMGLDTSGRIVMANAMAQRLLGADAATIQGSSLHKFLVERRGGRHRAWTHHRIANAIYDTGLYRSDQEIMRRSDGHRFPVEVVATVMPPLEGEELEAVLVFQDITRRREIEGQLVRLASCDPLTGFVNRVQFYANLNDAIERGRRAGGRVGVLYLDLDHFDGINDRYGHEMGDQLLLAFGARLKTRIRGADKIGRFGGDEFLVILENLKDATDIDKIGQELVALASEPVLINDQTLQVTASAGSAMFPEGGTDAAMLVRNADRAMCKAKASGRNCLVHGDVNVAHDTTRSAALRAALARAVTHGELELHYQPRVDIASGDIVGLEALIRWNHPELGQLSPAVFIPLAEDGGLITLLGEWVLRTVCEQACTWHRAGLWAPDMAMGVNVSRMELMEKSWGNIVHRVLDEFDVDPACLELEVTESDLMQNAAALMTLEGLGERGLSVAIDNFGTGYTSLGQLRRLPVRTLKMDQSLLRHIALDGSDAAIINAIVHMGESLNLHVVAEGVEQEEQVRFLRRARCRQAQGFHFSRPVSAPAAEALLKQGCCLGH